jgi:hypothetical protein
MTGGLGFFSVMRLALVVGSLVFRALIKLRVDIVAAGVMHKVLCTLHTWQWAFLRETREIRMARATVWVNGDAQGSL